MMRSRLQQLALEFVWTFANDVEQREPYTDTRPMAVHCLLLNIMSDPDSGAQVPPP